jgi:hypothetical protein
VSMLARCCLNLTDWRWVYGAQRFCAVANATFRGTLSNMAVKLSVHTVTDRASAHSAPACPTAYG